MKPFMLQWSAVTCGVIVTDLGDDTWQKSW